MNAKGPGALQGYKGGSTSARTPVEAPDSLVSTQQARIIDLLSEGEIFGLVDGANSIFLDEAPATTYPSLQWDFRTGTQDQSYMPGFPAVESEVNVGVAVTAALPYTRAISNTTVSAIRVNFSLGRFAQQNPSSGDTTGANVQFVIDLAEGFGPFKTVFDSAFNGKSTGGYTRSVRVDLTHPAPANGWRIQIRRITPDSTSQNISDVVTVASVTEIIDYKFRYPNSAIVGLSFDAEAFGGAIPKRSYRIKGRIIRVPDNYNPNTRTYAGVWSGEFKLAWSNNPAWVYYDILLNDRFGLGDRIDATQVDKWGLYQIAQYCDGLVDDGMGGQEPRYTCNLYLQQQADALKVLQDIAAVFRGITYWGLGQSMVSADMPSDPVYTYTNANVLGGRFDRKGSKKSTIYTAILSAWTDPNDFYRIKYEYVQDDALVAKFGIRTTTLANIGCSSQGQAHRAAKWALLSNQYDVNTVTFSVGLEGIRALPGQVVRVADQHRQGRRVGGRVRDGSTASVLILDQLPGVNVAVGDVIAVNLPNGQSEDRPVASVNVANQSLTVTVPFSAIPVRGAVWAYESEDLKTELYRLISITEGDKPLEYAITALAYTAGKHQAVDFGTIISDRPTTAVPTAVIAAPTNVQMRTTSMIDQSQAVSVLEINWDAVPKAVRYDVEWQRDNTGWVYAGRVATTEVNVIGVYAGTYRARVRAMNALNVLSAWTEIGPTFLNGKTTPPAIPVNVTTTSEIFAIRLDWGFPEGAGDTAFTQIRMADSFEGANLQNLGQFAYPTSTYTHSGMAAGVLKFFSLRLIDKSGNIGEWTTYVDGRSSDDAKEILDYLTGEITKSQLGQELLSEIGQIDGNGPGSVNERIGLVHDELSGAITETNNNVTQIRDELQSQIDQIADLADSMPYKPNETYTTGQGTLGADGIIYQALKAVPVNTPPPNTEFWLNVGQAVVTANGLAARVSTSETKITNIEGVNTAQATQISGLQTSLDGKASSAALQSLTSRVTTAEGTLSSQGTAITGLNNSLTATNTNVTAAQNAANAANTLAGGKGKALFQSATPAAADQLAQNIWIDTTGGANTPKRWNGTAWVAATDKVATDAAAAAAAALAQVATKAEASTVQALTNTVTQQGTDLAAAGTAITNINASLSQLGAGGANLLPAEMSVFGAVAPDTTANGGSTKTTTADAAAMKGYALTTTWTAATGQALLLARDFTFPSCNMSFKRQKYIVSFWAKADVAGHQVGCYLRTFLADNASTLTGPAPLFTLTTEWARYSAVIDMTSASFTGSQMAMVLQQNRSGVGGRTVWFDRIMLESAVGSVTEPSNFVIGNSFDQITTQASATTALSARVTQTESGLTSTGLQLTQLTNSIGDVGGQNLIYNPSFDKQGTGGTTGFADGWSGSATGGAARTISVVPSTLDPSGSAQRFDMTGLSTSVANYVQLYMLSTRLPPCSPGQSMTGSVYFRATAGLRLYMALEFWDAGVSNLLLRTAFVITVATGEWQRVSVTGTAPNGTVGVEMLMRTNTTGTPTAGFVEYDRAQMQVGTSLSGWQDNTGVLAGDQAATSTAVQSLQSSVTQQGTTITSVGSRVTTLENSVNNATTGLASKASASAVTALTNRVTAAEGTLASTSSDVTQLQNTIGAIGGSGANILPVEFTTFGATLPTMASGSGAVLSAVALATSTGGYLLKAGTASSATGYLYLGSSTVDYNLRLKPNGKYILSFWAYGSVAHSVGLRLKYLPATGNSVEVEVAQQAITATLTRYSVVFTAPAALVDRCVIVIFPNRTAMVADTFFDGFMLEAQVGNATAASDFVPGQAARQLSAQAAAVQALTTTVTQQGTTLSSVSQSTSNLQSTVGTHTSQISTLQTTTADSAGKISAAFSVRLQFATNGTRYVAGFGIGLDNSSGIVQSQFVVVADRFAVMRDSAGNLSSPFVIENGQVFIDSAFIRQATIVNLLVSADINSSALTSNSGLPLMQLITRDPNIIMRHQSNGNYIQINPFGLFLYANGIAAIELSL